MSCENAIAWTIAVAWILATVATQGRSRLATKVKSADRLSLIPAWTFFAPNPGVHDHAVVVRDLVVDEWSSWRVVWRESPNRWRPLWRPSKRQSKLVTDAIGTWKELRQELSPKESCYSLSFVLLASLAERAVAYPGSTIYQFGVADFTGAHGAPTLVTFVVSPPLRRRTRHTVRHGIT